jgi:hypothetical protein
LNTCGTVIGCKKEKILTKFDGESYEFNFSKFTRAPYETELPNEDFRVEQLASVACCGGVDVNHHPVGNPKRKV